ncbi:envelope-like protein, partial [Trifolium pratense]
KSVPEKDAALDATTSAAQENLDNIVIPESPDNIIVPNKEKGSEATATDNVFVHDTYVIPYADHSGKTMSVPLNGYESAEKDSNVIYVDNLNLTERTPAPSTRRLRSNTEFEEDQHATPSSKKSVKKKRIPQDVSHVPIDNISFHRVENVDKWKFVIKRRLVVERNLSKDFLQCQKLVDLINAAGLMKNCNWAPTTHSNTLDTGLARFIYVVGTRSPFDLGFHILDETVLHGKSCAEKMPIVFPTLMCDIILAQHPGICTEADVPRKGGCDLSFDFRLVEGTHAADCAASSVNQSTDVLP